MGAAEGHQLPGEREQFGVGRGPVEPGDLVVLAIGVVVALLGAAQLVAAQQHREPEGEQQGGEDRAGLARAQGQHGGVAGRALRAAVPGAVVAGPVAVGFAVGLVVLVVVGDQVARVKPSCTVIRFTEAVGRRRAPPYKSADPQNRLANSPRPIWWLRQ